MLSTALILASLALLVALAAWLRASSVKERLDSGRDDARRGEHAGQDAGAQLETLKQLVAVLAAGGKLTREQVLEGRLWCDVSPAEGARLVERGTLRIVDVRTPGEVAQGIIPGALCIPVDALQARLGELPRDGQPTLVYCAGGVRSAAACEFLAQQGYAQLLNLEGGFSAWPGPRARPPS